MDLRGDPRHAALVHRRQLRLRHQLGNLNIYGAIGQNYRGVVGTGAGGTGYLKNYEYDDRLATTEPPYFLTPLKAGWKIVRQTAQSPG